MECKHCGNDKYFYRKTRVTGATITVFNGDKSYEGTGLNADMHEPLEYKEGKFFYCYDCNKRGEPAVNKMDEILNQFNQGG